MKIETKYNVGDKVWTLNIDGELKASCYKIRQIKAIVGETKEYDYIEYTLFTSQGDYTIKEDRIFQTKEELLKSL